MRRAQVLITERLKKKADGKARVFYANNVPFVDPVTYEVWYNGDLVIITDEKLYALAYADGINHLHVFKGDTLKTMVCHDPKNQEYLEGLL